MRQIRGRLSLNHRGFAAFKVVGELAGLPGGVVAPDGKGPDSNRRVTFPECRRKGNLLVF
jgi:hypothetical protein